MDNRIYIHAPELPNTVASVQIILDRISKSGLHKNVNEINICASKGYGETLKQDLNFGEIKNFNVLESNYGPERFEYPTLSLIWNEAQTKEFNCLYLHAKGASKTSPTELENAKAWQNFMLFGVVDNWEKCLEYLADGADQVGSQWHWHWKGNYWWSKSNILKEMPDPLTLDIERYNGEYWCCLGYWWPNLPQPRVKNLFYLPDLGSDFMYSTHQAFIPTDSINVPEEYYFVDKRIDESQPMDIMEFLNRDYKCAVDKFYILKQDEELLPRLALYLSYDGIITILNEDGSWYEMSFTK